jgi:hypothetical protein
LKSKVSGGDRPAGHLKGAKEPLGEQPDNVKNWGQLKGRLVEKPASHMFNPSIRIEHFVLTELKGK